MRSGLRGLISILFTSILVFSFSYPAEAGPLKRPLTFRQVTPKEGLSSEMVYAIAIQGDEIWFGTYGGGATLYEVQNDLQSLYDQRRTHG